MMEFDVPLNKSGVEVLPFGKININNILILNGLTIGYNFIISPIIEEGLLIGLYATMSDRNETDPDVTRSVDEKSTAYFRR